MGMTSHLSWPRFSLTSLNPIKPYTFIAVVSSTSWQRWIVCMHRHRGNISRSGSAWLRHVRQKCCCSCMDQPSWILKLGLARVLWLQTVQLVTVNAFFTSDCWRLSVDLRISLQLPYKPQLEAIKYKNEYINTNLCSYCYRNLINSNECVISSRIYTIPRNSQLKRILRSCLKVTAGREHKTPDIYNKYL